MAQSIILLLVAAPRRPYRPWRDVPNGGSSWCHRRAKRPNSPPPVHPAQDRSGTGSPATSPDLRLRSSQPFVKVRRVPWRFDRQACQNRLGKEPRPASPEGRRLAPPEGAQVAAWATLSPSRGARLVCSLVGQTARPGAGPGDGCLGRALGRRSVWLRQPASPLVLTFVGRRRSLRRSRRGDRTRPFP